MDERQNFRMERGGDVCSLELREPIRDIRLYEEESEEGGNLGSRVTDWKGRPY